MIQIKALQSLYDKIPGVPCIAGCTACCVTPNVTLCEYIFLVCELCERYTGSELSDLIVTPMRNHPWFEGNYYCRFQNDKGICINHIGRGAACRLHGLPVIQKLGVSNMENCTIMEQNLLPQIEVDTAQLWLEELLALNKALYPTYGESFLRLIGLNIECWLDITYSDNINSEELREYQTLIHQYCPQLPSLENYKAFTEIFEKIDTIQLLDMCVQLGDKDSALKALNKLISGFPTTGTFFAEQAEWMKRKIEASG